ncbi:hypothetical protein C5S29_01145 [ANME-1 cluster archaeon GoMg3.2]|nr:hypothetical protein [ANME-1 cluster archaeon GoMg3.2]
MESFLISKIYLSSGAEKMKFKVVMNEDLEDGGYNVSCPALPGCHSQGDTMEEALENIKDAILGCMEVINQRALQGVEEKAIEVAV